MGVKMKRALISDQSEKRLSIRPRVKLWFELDGERAFCPGVYRILTEVEKTGSMKDAASAIGRSYRFVWGKIKHVEQAIGYPLVEARVGGSQIKRSVLTAMGRMLIREFEAMRERVFELIDGELAPRLQHEIQRVRREG